MIFLRELGNLFLPAKCPTLGWDLSLVLKGLTESPFEAMTTCSLLHLLMKTAFQVAVTLAWQVGEIGAHMACFSKIRSHYSHAPSFYQKYLRSSMLTSLFTFLSLTLNLTWVRKKCCYTHARTHDVRRVLAFYFDRTKSFKSLPNGLCRSEIDQKGLQFLNKDFPSRYPTLAMNIQLHLLFLPVSQSPSSLRHANSLYKVYFYHSSLSEKCSHY